MKLIDYISVIQINNGYVVKIQYKLYDSKGLKDTCMFDYFTATYDEARGIVEHFAKTAELPAKVKQDMDIPKEEQLPLGGV